MIAKRSSAAQLLARPARRAQRVRQKCSAERRVGGGGDHVKYNFAHQAIITSRPVLPLSPRRAPPHSAMLDNLTNRLSRVMKTLRGEARLTEANIRRRPARGAHGAARGRRRAAGGEGLHRAGEGEGARRGGRRQPHAGPGAGGRRAPRAHRPDGRRQRGAQPRRRAAGDHPDGRPAGLGQDHHARQARASCCARSRRRRCWWCPATSTARPPSSS